MKSKGHNVIVTMVKLLKKTMNAIKYKVSMPNFVLPCGHFHAVI